MHLLGTLPVTGSPKPMVSVTTHPSCTFILTLHVTSLNPSPTGNPLE
uniref:Uncharacterized protein n=1 Tax=Physcomitrium patens TaxID=3218 RepID=A0A2K1JME2_PHYPA|nr:hypothetical protein PHYPA_017376 [Physcomitrium patens]